MVHNLTLLFFQILDDKKSYDLCPTLHNPAYGTVEQTVEAVQGKEITYLAKYKCKYGIFNDTKRSYTRSCVSNAPHWYEGKRYDANVWSGTAPTCRGI